MGAYQVVFTPHASGDLEQIVRYIARDNPDAAQRFGDKLVDRKSGVGMVPTRSN